MKILIVHALEDVESARRTVLNQSFFLLKYAPHHDYTLQCLRHPLSEETVNKDYDIIVIDCTILCYRWASPSSFLQNLKEKYDFIRRSSAKKIAFPQDDYDHYAILDQWMVDWKVDVIFSPLAEYADELYPQSSRKAAILPCLTGYVDSADIAIIERHAQQPMAERRIDVGYRARRLPYKFGRFGLLKSDIADRFTAAVQKSGATLALDISTRPEATILGTNWLKFLGNCRFVLGTASGSSLLDPDGRVQNAILAYQAVHPNADFDEVEMNCFPGLEGRRLYATLGPRILEAAAVRACQILVPNDGLKPLLPDVHYIPLDPFCKNIDEVLSKMADLDRAKAMADATYDLLISSNDYKYESLTKNLFCAVGKESEYILCIADPIDSLIADCNILQRLYKHQIQWMQNHEPMRRPLYKAFLFCQKVLDWASARIFRG